MKKYIVPTIDVLENEVEACLDKTMSGDEIEEGFEGHSKQGGGNTFNFVGSFSDDDK